MIRTVTFAIALAALAPVVAMAAQPADGAPARHLQIIVGEPGDAAPAEGERERRRERLEYREADGRTVRAFADRPITRDEVERELARAREEGERAREEGRRAREDGLREAEQARAEGARARAEGLREAEQARREGERARAEGRRAAEEGLREAEAARREAERARAELADVG